MTHTLIVWTFYTSFGDDDVLSALGHVNGTPGMEGHATVTWPAGATIPIVDAQTVDAGLDDAFWGLLFGVAFYGPLLSAATASPAGRGHQMLGGIGLDNAFLNTLRDAITPGTFAIFAVASQKAVDRLVDDAAPCGPEKVLRAALDLDDTTPIGDLFGGT